MNNKKYTKYCKWCEALCEIIPASQHWTNEEKNKCTNCGAFNQ